MDKLERGKPWVFPRRPGSLISSLISLFMDAVNPGLSYPRNLIPNPNINLYLRCGTGIFLRLRLQLVKNFGSGSEHFPSIFPNKFKNFHGAKKLK
jgi:hypothetical protein